MTTDNIKVSIETSREGRPVRTYVHDGRTYIESHEDLVYRIRVKNLTGKRIKAVISVDGVSIVTGKAVSTDPTETGYILGPYADELFKGFRVDENQVAEFKFVKREASYATETGNGQGNGVIAVRAYCEKEKPAPDLAKMWREMYEAERAKPREKEYIWPMYPPKIIWRWEDDWYRPAQPYWLGVPTCGDDTFRGMSMGTTCKSDNVLQGMAFNACASADVGSFQNAGVAMAAVAQSAVEEPSPFQHGSGWGSAIADKVTEVAFKVGVLLAEVAIYYAPAVGLVALGVNMTREKQVTFPEPFKREFATPPKGWHSGVK